MCECKEFDKWRQGTIQEAPFKTMEIIQSKPKDWCHLVRCLSCGQLWQVDEWDKYQQGIAIKFLGDKDTWETISDREIRKEIMIANHNGISEKECQWFGCKNKALGNMVFCVDHAYQSGIRE